jgi:hypothetical protein
MKERFELVYYIVFMILMTGGLSAGILEEVVGNGNFEEYVGFIAIGFLMTLARFIYNGQHFWNPPFEKPSNGKIIGFVVVSMLIVGNINWTLIGN